MGSDSAAQAVDRSNLFQLVMQREESAEIKTIKYSMGLAFDIMRRDIQFICAEHVCIRLGKINADFIPKDDA